MYWVVALALALPLMPQVKQPQLEQVKQPQLERVGPAAPTRLCDDVEQFRGFFKLRTGPGSKNYFYWHFAARASPESAPTVLWLTGGPGCSSEVRRRGRTLRWPRSRAR